MRQGAHKEIKQRQAERDDDASEPYSDELDISSPEILELGDEGEVILNSNWVKNRSHQKKQASTQGGNEEDMEQPRDEDEDEDEDEWSSEEASENEAEIAQRKLGTVSFDLLAKAQASLDGPGKKRKRLDHDEEAEKKLAILKKRLKELKQDRATKQRRHHASDNGSLNANAEASDLESDGESDGPDKRHRSHQRSSKHAPACITSTRTVTRKRQIMDLPKSKARDPRFDPTGGQVHHERIRKNYAFLDDYIDSEINQLKTTLDGQKALQKLSNSRRASKHTPKLNHQDIEAMKKELTQKVSIRATQQARDERMGVIQHHKKMEKELVRSGKQPYFLKNSDVKKKILVDRFDGMSQGKREKTMEKKRRKMASKERRNMPDIRRQA